MNFILSDMMSAYGSMEVYLGEEAVDKISDKFLTADLQLDSSKEPRFRFMSEIW